MGKRIFNLICITFVFALLILNFASALEGNIGNARMVLYPKVGFFGTTIEKSILVKNLNNVSINISLVASDEFKDIIDIIDNEFTLQPGENKDAQFKIKLKKEGDYEGSIGVFFKPIEGKGAGVALTSTIIIHATKQSFWGDDSDNETTDDETDNADETDNVDETEDTNTENFSDNIFFYILLIFPVILLAILLILLVKFGKRKRRGDRGKR